MSAELQPSPYEQAAHSYLSKGWSPIPIPPRAKKAPPVGYTGYTGKRPSGADIQDWIDHGVAEWPLKKDDPCPPEVGNIAIRLPDGVIAIDVDDYGEKQGGKTLAALEAELGRLPPTYSSTSRDDGVSRIRFYRVRGLRRRWSGIAGPDIEIIHYGDRYTIVAPSLHKDTGLPYRWLDLADRQCSAPRPTDLTLLPDPWEKRYDLGDVSERAGKQDVSQAQAFQLLQGYPEGPKCHVLEGEVDRASAELAAATSRHDTMRDIVGAVIRHGERGHKGSVEALTEILDIWHSALRFGERREPDPGEFERMVTGGIGMVLKQPTLAENIGCCGSVAAGGVVFDPAGWDLGFWKSRPELAIIYEFARARMAAPWAVLLCVLARVVTAVPPRVVLPPVIGGECSLNLFVALVGAPGAGKGAAEAVAAECVKLPDIHMASVGSGEGIAHMYKHRDKGVLVPDRDAVLFSIPEVDTLTALGNRQGATLMPQLRQAYMGEQLGFGTADVTRRIPLLPHEYRMSIILSVQPERAGQLLSDAGGGTPQRFVFGSVIDRDAPPADQVPPEPAAYVWSLEDRYRVLPAMHGHTWIAYCDQVDTAIRANRWAQNKGETVALDGHLMLARLKIAAALGILNGRLSVNEQDWELSDMVLRMNLATRNGIERDLAAVTKRSNEAKAHAEADRASIVENRAHVERVNRVAKRIVKVMGVFKEATRAFLRHELASRDREVFSEAIELLLEDGRIIEAGDGYELGKS